MFFTSMIESEGLLNVTSSHACCKSVISQKRCKT